MYGEYLITIGGKGMVTLYGIMIAVGLLCCMLTLNFIGKKAGLTDKSIEFYEYNAFASIAVGFGSAFLFQYIYDLIDGSGRTGASTFIGGLIGGVAVFLLVTLFLAKPEVKAQFPLLLQVGVCCVLIAHAFGRVGCFFAGCCYGKHTDSAFGISFPYGGSSGTVIPTMLYEAIFLFAMYALCVGLILKKKPFNASVYLLGYGLWRFVLEYFRGDNRGTLVPGVSPSQFWSILFFLLGAVILALQLIDHYKVEILNKLPKFVATAGGKLNNAYLIKPTPVETQKPKPENTASIENNEVETTQKEQEPKPEREKLIDEFED